MQMRDQTDKIGPQGQNVNSPGSRFVDEIRSGRFRPQVNHVGLHRLKIDFQSGNVLKSGSQGTGSGMVLGQPVPVVLKSIQSGRSQHPRLPHPAAKRLSPSMGLVDHFARTDQDTPYGSTQPLGNANGNGIAITNDSSRILTARHSRVKNTGTVQVKGAIRFPRHYGNFINYGLRIKGSSTPVRGILDANKTAVRVMIRTLRRLSDFCLHRLRLHDPSFAGNQSHRTTGQGGESTRLVDVNMTVLLGYDLVTRLSVSPDGDRVGHRATRNHQPRLLPHDRSHLLLQLNDRGILTEDIVPDDGRGHCFPHGQGWLGDRIAAQIDPVRWMLEHPVRKRKRYLSTMFLKETFIGGPAWT